MKAYFKCMIFRWLSVIVILFGSYGFFDYTVWHCDTVNTIPESKAEVVVKEDNGEVLVEAVVDEKVPEQQPEPAVVQEPVQQSTPVIKGNSITIPGSLYNILMKDETGEHFYLNHDIYGNYNGIGVPYIDFRTDFNTRKTIIYSHSSPNGNGPFQPLQNYHNNKGYYDGHRYIVVNYNGVQYTYEIFSVYVSLADSEESEGLEYFHNIYYSDEEWGNRIQWYKNNSEYDTGVSVSSSDKILILQTCSMDPNYYQRYYRYNLVIMGKLI